MSGWSVAVVSKTARTIGISWSSPISPLNGGIHFYVALVRKINSSSESVGEVVAGNVTSAEITELDEYTEYKVSVIAVDGDGMPFKSAEVLVMTDEWGEYSTVNYDVELQPAEERIFPPVSLFQFLVKRQMVFE